MTERRQIPTTETLQEDAHRHDGPLRRFMARIVHLPLRKESGAARGERTGRHDDVVLERTVAPSGSRPSAPPPAVKRAHDDAGGLAGTTSVTHASPRPPVLPPAPSVPSARKTVEIDVEVRRGRGAYVGPDSTRRATVQLEKTADSGRASTDRVRGSAPDHGDAALTEATYVARSAPSAAPSSLSRQPDVGRSEPIRIYGARFPANGRYRQADGREMRYPLRGQKGYGHDEPSDIGFQKGGHRPIPHSRWVLERPAQQWLAVLDGEVRVIADGMMAAYFYLMCENRALFDEGRV